MKFKEKMKKELKYIVLNPAIPPTVSLVTACHLSSNVDGAIL